MKLSLLEKSSVRVPEVQLARFSGAHGYRFEGDIVHMNALFALLDPAAHEHSWVLQLWACPVAPADTKSLDGHIVAEVGLPPIGEVADETEQFEVSAFAWSPANVPENGHVMVLTLGTGSLGHIEQAHDMAVYPRCERFDLPRLSGNVGYRLDGALVHLTVDRVRNERGTTNRSGTLSLELWALPAGFNGGRFQGHHLAGVEIGSLNGDTELALKPITLDFNAPPPGEWQIVLMLREWTSQGFLTRDFTNFATRYISAPIDAPKALETPVKKEPSVFIAVKEPQTERVAVAVEIPQIESSNDPDGFVCVNTATVDELTSVKGLTKKLAEGIVRKRPFASLDDLRKVKGLSAKTLGKIRSLLKL